MSTASSTTDLRSLFGAAYSNRAKNASIRYALLDNLVFVKVVIADPIAKMAPCPFVFTILCFFAHVEYRRNIKSSRESSLAPTREFRATS